jgi:SAM-dependent methyltransferase
MVNINGDEIKRQIARFQKLQPWNHNYRLPGEIETRPGMQTSHGKNEVKWRRIEPLLKTLHLHNKTVLDVGCNEGFFSQKLSEMGAKVIGIDVDEIRIEKAKFVHSLLRVPDTEFRCVDIYSKEFDSLSQVDFCLCMGFLHRIPDPFTALKRLTEKANIILFEWKALKFGPHHESFAFYTPGGFEAEDFYGTPYWIMSYKCVESMLSRLGYDRFFRVDDPSQKRAILVAGRIDHAIFAQKDIVARSPLLKVLMRHTKQYLMTLAAIIRGEINS